MELRKANTDTTYCVNDKCEHKCPLHIHHYEFDENQNYWYQAYCTEYLERHNKGEV